MDAKILIESFAEFARSKNVDRPTMIRILEDVFRAMIRKKFESDENFDVTINADKGDLIKKITSVLCKAPGVPYRMLLLEKIERNSLKNKEWFEKYQPVTYEGYSRWLSLWGRPARNQVVFFWKSFSYVFLMNTI